MSIIAYKWENSKLYLLDQRLLPLQEHWLELIKSDMVVDAIKNMSVRGAPLIGISAAYACVLAAREVANYPLDWRDIFTTKLNKLANARPTAVNLIWAINLIRKKTQDASLDNLYQICLNLAEEIAKQDLKNNQKMAELGTNLISKNLDRGNQVMTLCNTGALATAGLGTALGVIRKAWSDDIISKVHINETRPWLQGSRLSAWEMQKEGINYSLNVDSAAAWVLQNNPISWIIIGADRVSANGMVANKIGSLNLAVLAKHYGVKFMVVAPQSTFDKNWKKAEDLKIEQRDSTEVLRIGEHQIGLPETQVYNPVFDIVPANLIEVIVSETGCFSYFQSTR